VPIKIGTPCAQRGCPAIVVGRFCDAHQKAYNQKRYANRHAHQKLYDYKWQKARDYYLSKHPFCRQCEHDGMTTAATEVDHIDPHKGDPAIFWNKDNWQALCKPCHSRKTVQEDGGFGNY